MKKLLALLLVALMAVSVAACAPSPGDINDIMNDALNGLQSELESNIDADLDIDIDNDDDDNADDDNTDETVSVNFNANMTEQVVYNNKGIKVTATEITYEEYYGPTIAFLVENDTDMDISVNTEYISVNNFVFPSSLYVDVADGKKAYGDMYLYESDLAECGITDLGTVEFKLHIYDNESYNTIDDSDTIKLVINEDVVSAPAPKGDKIYSGNGITVYTEECKEEDDDYYEYVTRFFTVNETNKNVTLSCEDVAVNGFMIDPYCSIDVPAGKMAYTNLYFYDSDLESNRIDDIEEVEFYFNAYDSDSYDDLFESEVITIKAD